MRISTAFKKLEGCVDRRIKVIGFDAGMAENGLFPIDTGGNKSYAQRCLEEKQSLLLALETIRTHLGMDS